MAKVEIFGFHTKILFIRKLIRMCTSNLKI